MNASVNLHPTENTRAEVNRKGTTVWITIKDKSFGGITFFLPDNCPGEIAEEAAEALNKALTWRK